MIPWWWLIPACALAGVASIIGYEGFLAWWIPRHTLEEDDISGYLDP